MAESVRFDFLSTGAGRLEGDLRKTGDAALLASRGAKVLADVIDKLGDKEDRTAKESLLLARALRLTGDAEDKVTAKAVAADAAVRRLSDAMGDTKQAGFFKRTSTWGGLGKTLAGLLPGVAGGAAGAAGAGGQGAAAAGSGIFSNPYTAVPAVAAGLAALPFAAQAAAGAITVGLGGALTGIGVLGASSSKKVQNAFGGVKKTLGTDLRSVAQPFVGALSHIAVIAQSVIPTVFLGLATAMKTLAGPFKTFADSFIQAFAQPAVTASVQAVAKAFGGILKALAPQLGTDIKDVATGIERIANTISKNPGVFAAVISFFFKATGFAFSMVAALTSVANYIEKHFIPALNDIRKAWDVVRHETAVIFDGIRHDIAHVWDQIFENTIGTVIRLGHNVETQFNSLRRTIAGIFDTVRHATATVWDAIWTNTVGRTQRGIASVLRFVGGLPGKIRAVFSGAGKWLYGAGKDVIQGFWNGLLFIWHKVTGFISSIASWIKAHKGPVHLDATLLEPAGRALMGGLLKGLVGGFGGVADFVGGVAGKIGSALGSGALGAQGIAASMLQGFGWGMDQLAPLVALWNRESGWNRFARNPTSGAYGIPQALPPTKMPYAAQAAGGSNAAAQIAWGLSYIKGRYGSPAGAWAHELAAGWYGSGLANGIFTRPTLIGVGERGPELVNVRPLHGGHGSGAAVTYNVTVQVGHGTHPVAAAREIVDILNQGAKAGVKLRPSILNSFG